MKTPGSSKTSSGKSKTSKTKTKFPSNKALRREYKAEARREDASARREEIDAAHRRAEAAHYQQEAAKAEREGYKKEAEYDLAKARREQAEARADMAKARRNQAKAARNQHKAAHVGLAQPPTFSPESCRSGQNLQPALHPWILGGNDWHRGCAAVALANSLLAATGQRVSDRDVLDLYWLTADDPDAGAGVLATLETAEEFGLGGMRPVARRDLDSVDALTCGDAYRHSRYRRSAARPVGVIVDLRLQQAQRRQPVWDASPSPDWGAHAALLAGDKVISWGREIPVTRDFLAQRVAGAWRVEWPVPALPR